MVHYLYTSVRHDLFSNLLLSFIRSICSTLDIFLYRKALVYHLKKSLNKFLIKNDFKKNGN